MVLSDKEIREYVEKYGMISPFTASQVKKGVISFGISSYGYDFRIADEFKIFTNVNNAIVDPKNFDSKSFVDFKGKVCIIPPNSFLLGRSIEYFKIPRDVIGICLGKSTYARCLPGGTQIVCEIEKQYRNQYLPEKRTVKALGSKKIENIKIGDKVLSYNEKTGTKEYDIVTNIFNRKTNKLINLTLSNGNELKLTEEHPVFVINKGWVEANQLQLGDEIIQYKYVNLHRRIFAVKNKTFAERFGPERTKKIREKMSVSCSKAHRGVLLKESHKANIRLSMNRPKIIEKMSKIRRGLKYEQLVGKERAEQWIKKVSIHSKRMADEGRIFKFTSEFQRDLERKRKEKLGIKYVESKLKNLCGFSLKPNRSELKLNEYLRKYSFNLNVRGEIEKKYNIDFRGKRPDFINVEKKKIIEFFGLYWHSKEKTGKGKMEHELETNDHYSNLNWDCLIVWEDELKDIENLIKKVETFAFNPNIEIVTIDKIDKLQLNKEIEVYNFETLKNHNYFAQGILVHNCGIIVNVTPLEPMWRGYVTVEISNTTPLPAKIYAGEGICQIIFVKGSQICEISYEDRKGKYQKQEGLTLPKV